MAEPENRSTAQSRGLGTTSLILAGLLLPLLYCLSTGPVSLAFKWAFEGSPWAEVMGMVLSIIYLPVVWLYEHCEPVERFYDWYHSLFGL